MPEDYAVRRDDEGEQIECEVCRLDVPLSTFRVWDSSGGAIHERESFLCEFCASTCSSLRPIEPNGHVGQSLLFHEIRALRAALRSTTREA